MYLRSVIRRVIPVSEIGRPKLECTTDQLEVYDVDWEVPVRFRSPETSLTVVRFWAATYTESTGQMPACPPFTQIRQADLLIAKLGYKEVVQTLAFMASPFSKYFQYPYSLRVVENAHDELLSVRQLGPQKVYDGFVGRTTFRCLDKGADDESKRTRGC